MDSRREGAPAAAAADSLPLTAWDRQRERPATDRSRLRAHSRIMRRAMPETAAWGIPARRRKERAAEPGRSHRQAVRDLPGLRLGRRSTALISQDRWAAATDSVHSLRRRTAERRAVRVGCRLSEAAAATTGT